MWVPDWVQIGEPIPQALEYHYITATRTTKGCIRKCPFCAVPQIEGKFRELKKWRKGMVLIDNNLLAASKRHFIKVMDHLKKYKWCDFSQGLDSRLLTKWHAEKIAGLSRPTVRLAWDYTSYESSFFQACELLEKAGIPKRKINCYVLIGFNDTPEDALYRLQTIDNQGYVVFPMRYQPLNAKTKNEYVHKNWTDYELKRYMKYWSSKRYFAGIPFEDFDYNLHRRLTR